MVHWSSRIVEILQSKSGNLKELAELAGVDWKTAYIGQSLANCDLRGQDLSGINLTGCEIERANIDDATIIDPEFDPRSTDTSRYIAFVFPVVVDEIAQKFAYESSYTYLAWAYRNLLSQFLDMHRYGDLEKILNTVEANENFAKLIKKKNSGKMTRQMILVEKWKEIELEELKIIYPQYNIFAAAIFLPALWKKVGKYKNSDLSGLTLKSIWPNIS